MKFALLFVFLGASFLGGGNAGPTNRIHGSNSSPGFNCTVTPQRLRNAVTNRKWPGGVVHYSVHSSIKNKKWRSQIQQAVTYYKQTSCLKWEPRTNQNAYVEFRSDAKGCNSPVGRTGGRQVINLETNCWNGNGPILHEMLHAMGFDHEQNRPDRKKYVKILWENIDPDYDIAFKENKQSKAILSYDYTSIMHYEKAAFTKNGKDTIKSLTGKAIKPSTSKPNALDLKKLNTLYSCKSGGGTGGKTNYKQCFTTKRRTYMSKGQDLRTLKNASQDSCKKACYSDSRCKAASFRSDSRECYLHASVRGTGKNKVFTCFIKKC